MQFSLYNDDGYSDAVLALMFEDDRVSTNKNYLSRLVGKPTCGFRTGLTQTGLHSHRRWLEAGNFGFRK